MAENVTTLLDKWQKQKQDHPDWVPALEDILYVIHGTGTYLRSGGGWYFHAGRT